MTTTTRSPEETRAISRLRALSQGVKVKLFRVEGK